ncbi:hypothetical protein DPMN_039389 [Dreissena polymorpha]|uniref:FLYWCH-type domain-containing protein n=1 Tax=Dreissena polymorpha TaxID=45954 RepID=A0A9D4MFW1_DREPO|nr:hypothetical protein DPMN_039389 [Dreissena polymorpha]
MEDPSLSDSIVEPSPITYEVMQGASQRGKDLLVTSTGYTYNVKETNSSCIVWWCTVRNPTVRCPARVPQSANHFIRARRTMSIRQTPAERPVLP